MPRYIKAKGRRFTTDADALQKKLLRELESEGRRILKQLTTEAVGDFSKLVQGENGKLSTTSPGAGNGGTGLFSGSGLGRILGTAISSILFRPRTTVTTRETRRSRETDQLFRLSHVQSLAEAGIELNKGNKNL